MSYCRISEESDIYLISSLTGGLQLWIARRALVDAISDSYFFEFEDNAGAELKMLGVLELLSWLGLKVPPRAKRRLLMEINEILLEER